MDERGYNLVGYTSIEHLLEELHRIDLHIHLQVLRWADAYALCRAPGRTRGGGPAEASMHLLGWLPEGSDDQVLAQFLERRQVFTRPLSGFCLEPSPQCTVLLEYAAVPIPSIQEGVRHLTTALA